MIYNHTHRAWDRFSTGEFACSSESEQVDWSWLVFGGLLGAHLRLAPSDFGEALVDLSSNSGDDFRVEHNFR